MWVCLFTWMEKKQDFFFKLPPPLCKDDVPSLKWKLYRYFALQKVPYWWWWCWKIMQGVTKCSFYQMNQTIRHWSLICTLEYLTHILSMICWRYFHQQSDGEELQEHCRCGGDLYPADPTVDAGWRHKPSGSYPDQSATSAGNKEYRLIDFKIYPPKCLFFYTLYINQNDIKVTIELQQFWLLPDRWNFSIVDLMVKIKNIKHKELANFILQLGRCQLWWPSCNRNA